MLFNSVHFLFFFPLVTVFFFVLPHRVRWAWLLLASCYFYMSFLPVYILVLFFIILVDYLAGIGIEASTGKQRKILLITSLVANIGLLVVFKYYNFIVGSLPGFLHTPDGATSLPLISWALPIGLSFHTFQAMSYTIEVYRGNQRAERHLGIYALYVLFYPQMVAGPIERPQNILPQLHTRQVFNYENVVSGLQLMAWGFFKKIVIADRLAPMVDSVYGHPKQFMGPSMVLATVLFSFQIFCDFSGYSDIALGAARVMGYKLMTNFDRPYFSKNITEFWRRWHISLSTWFRDYVYIPLGGNRVPMWRQAFNLFLVFILSGIWHGANWTFVIWGALHGVYLFVELVARRGRKRSNANPVFIKKVLHVGLTFSFVSFAWIFFRASSVQDAFYIISHLAVGWQYTWNHLSNPEFVRTHILLKESEQLFTFSLLAIVLMELVHYLQRNPSWQTRFRMQPIWVRWSVYYVGILLILLFGAFNKPAQFIYFQF
ncbi:MBOAT family O-acyltransferase [Spirosoma pulveris]